MPLFSGLGPIVKQAAYTQTYSTATRTVPAPTATSVVTTAATLALYGLGQAQMDSLPVTANALVADVAVLFKLVNSLIDDEQANSLAG